MTFILIIGMVLLYHFPIGHRLDRREAFARPEQPHPATVQRPPPSSVASGCQRSQVEQAASLAAIFSSDAGIGDAGTICGIVETVRIPPGVKLWEPFSS